MEVQENGEMGTISSESARQKTRTRKRFWRIDREMLRFKLHFFLFMGGVGSVFPYITIFAKNRIDISASSMASILIVQQFLYIFTRPLIGCIADYFNKLKVIICILTTVQTVLYLLLLSIPKIEMDKEQVIHINNTNFQNTYGYLNSSHLYVNCKWNGENFLSSETVLFENNNESKRCFISQDNLSAFSDECSKQDSKSMNISEISTLNILFSAEKTNKLSIALSSTFFANCTVCCKSSSKCQNIQCEIPRDKGKVVSSEKKSVSDFETYQFWVYAVLTTIAMSCTVITGLITLSDTACYESVEKFGAQFGRQRLFGAMGFGLISPIGGLLNDYTNDFTASWILMAALSIATIVNIFRLDLVKPQFTKDLLKDIGSVLRSKEFLVFTLLVLLNGVCTGVVWYYLVWYLTDIGASRFLCGMVQAVQCFVGEIPCFFFSGWVIKKIGHFNVITLSLTCFGIRFLWYSYLNDPWWVLLTEALDGITYGLTYTAVASYAKLSAKPGTEATTQAVLFATHEGLGAGTGCVVAGLGFDSLGGRSTFFFLSAFAGCGVILSIVLHLIIRRWKRSTT